MIYLKEFESVEAYNTFAASEEFIEPNVSMIGEYGQPGFGLKFSKDKPGHHDYSQDYLTFNISNGGNIGWYFDGEDESDAKVIEYSKNDGEWVSITATTGGTLISVQTGDVVKFRGNNATYSNDGDGWHNVFNDWDGTLTTAEFSVEGNIMSLIYGDNFINQTTLQSADTFCYLFNMCTGLTSVENLVLPATTLAQSCYMSMFDGCTSLTTAPELPATTLATGCYDGMFFNCTSLTTAPELPATALTAGCYSAMFGGCTSLTTAPELPATALTAGCYSGMFGSCTSLNYIKCLATDISAETCTNSWVDGVSSTGTFVKNANMSSWGTGIDGIPSNWTVQDAS